MEKSLPLPLPRMLALAESEFAGVKGFKSAESDLTEFLYDRLRGLLRDLPSGKWTTFSVSK